MQLISASCFGIWNANKITGWFFCPTFSGKMLSVEVITRIEQQTLICFLSPSHIRASDIETAQQIFWKQADFGYVRERLSEVKTHCKPAATVGISDRCDALPLFFKIIFVIDRILLVLNRGIHLWPVPSTSSIAEQQTCTLIYGLWREPMTGLWFACVTVKTGWQGEGFENLVNKAGLLAAMGFTADQKLVAEAL